MDDYNKKKSIWLKCMIDVSDKLHICEISFDGSTFNK